MHKDQSFTISDIQSFLDTKYPQLTKVSDRSIRKILKGNLRFSYMRICLIQRKLFWSEYTRRLFESALLLIVLENEEYELLYVDELNINFQTRSNNDRGLIGNDGFLQAHEERFSMSFKADFSCRRIYGIIGNTESHTFEFYIFY